MVDAEINYDKKTATVTDPTKIKSNFIITTAPGGYIFYQVNVDKGSVPEELSGKYSGLDVAVKAVSKYLENKAPSVSVKRDKKAADRKAHEEKMKAKAKELENGTADHAEGSQ